MDSFRSYVQTNVTDSYSRSHPGDSARLRLDKNAFPGGTINPLFSDIRQADVWRIERDEEDEEVVDPEAVTSFDQARLIDSKDDVDSIAPALRPSLRGLLNQPPLLQLGLIRDFETAVNQPPAASNSNGEPPHRWKQPSYSCSDATPPSINALKVMPRPIQ